MNIEKIENIFSNRDILKDTAVLTVIVIVGCVCCLPFINKAVHIDCDMLVHASRQMARNPLNPPLGDYGRNMAVHNHTNMPQSSIFFRCPHPPFLPLLLAPVARYSGMKEWPFHVVMLLFYVLSIIGVWFLFGMFFSRRLQIAGTLLWALSPALLVNAQNIMWDVPVVVFIIWALYFFFLAKRTGKKVLVFYCGLITGLGALTKMNIAPLYILIPGYFCLVRQWKNLVIWLIPAMALPGLWVLHNIFVFGTVHYFATDHLHFIPGDFRYRFERIIGFMGGCIFLPLWWYWLIAVSKKRIISYIPFLLFSIVWGILLYAVLKKPLALALSYIVFSSVGFWALFRTLLSGVKSRNMKFDLHEGALVSGFSLLYLITMEFLPLASVRFMLPLLPFVIMVILDMAAGFSLKNFYLFTGSAIAGSLCFSLCLCYADYLICDADRKLPSELRKRRYSPENTWYFGRMSYDYYLFHNGFRNLLTDPEKPKIGDHVLKESIPGDYGVENFFMNRRLISRGAVESRYFPLRTIGFLAGFYGNDRIPYSLDFHHPQRRVEVYEITNQ